MSTTEIRERIDRMTAEERFFAAAYLYHIGISEDPAWGEELSRRQRAVDDGRKYSLEQVKALHESLTAAGV